MLGRASSPLNVIDAWVSCLIFGERTGEVYLNRAAVGVEVQKVNSSLRRGIAQLSNSYKKAQCTQGFKV